ncbi:MAG: Bfr protein [Clostridia bacterium]|nr:Bfr protein [Clostridia bacterium]
MTFEEKINALNGLAKAWYSTSQAGSIHEEIFRAQGLGKFADLCKEEAEEELEEAKKCTARVVALGGKPEYGFDPQEIHDDPKALLDQWYKEFTELGGLQEVNDLAKALDDDVVTRKMVEEFAEGEAEHYAWVSKHLAIIEKLGYENYLLEMMDI